MTDPQDLPDSEPDAGAPAQKRPPEKAAKAPAKAGAKADRVDDFLRGLMPKTPPRPAAPRAVPPPGDRSPSGQPRGGADARLSVRVAT